MSKGDVVFESQNQHCNNFFGPIAFILWGSLLGKKRLAAICSGRVPGACPPRVRLVSALAGPPNLVRHTSAVTALCPPPPTSPCVYLLCVPCVCSPCVRHVPALWQPRSMCPRLLGDSRLLFLRKKNFKEFGSQKPTFFMFSC